MGEYFVQRNMQDHMAKEVVAVAKQIKHLYILSKQSFDAFIINSFLLDSSNFISRVIESDTLLWHKRLGHPSLKVHEHIPAMKNEIKTAEICTTLTPSQTLNTTLPPVPDTEDITDDITPPILDTSPHSTDRTSPDSAPFVVVTSLYLVHLLDLLGIQELRTYSQSQGQAKWELAMQEEIQALEKNNTWNLTSLPDGKWAIGSRWVYKLKLNPNDSVSRYKACLIAKGYTQIEGMDYTKSFSLIAKNVTVRLFLSIAAAYSWLVYQLDINNAFLHGHLDEEVYMTPPEGYSVQPGMTLGDFGFRQFAHDHYLFIKLTGTEFLALLVYVKDIHIMGPAEALIIEVKNYLDALFTIKDLGYAKYFLGLEIARSSDGMSVTQRKYISDIITDAGMIDAHEVLTPLPQGVKFSSELGASLSDPEKYRRLIGRL
ncbi:UNVERIFIED_CONTAM: Retrovirus-related Pol polyprotein from transposon TNT 1-94 [Sesamum latifolium]|uniref:Retrovirus-related Pol polyprotein from transposon TNT 1-94 n=1 Tax=Sesamum latifolium TaxID=2727402 RepID=A0AAW2XKH2_9LAMI